MTFELVRKVSEHEVMSASALTDLRQTVLFCRRHALPNKKAEFFETGNFFVLVNECMASDFDINEVTSS